MLGVPAALENFLPWLAVVLHVEPRATHLWVALHKGKAKALHKGKAENVASRASFQEQKPQLAEKKQEGEEAPGDAQADWVPETWNERDDRLHEDKGIQTDEESTSSEGPAPAQGSAPEPEEPKIPKGAWPKNTPRPKLEPKLEPVQEETPWKDALLGKQKDACPGKPTPKKGNGKGNSK
eukprot:s2897_g12.t1